MEDHVKIVAVLNIVLGALGIGLAVLILMVFGGVAGLVAQDGDPDANVAVPILVTVGSVLFFILLIVSVPSVIGGIGLLKFREWARILMIIVSILNLLHVPIGTAVGVYGLWVLFKDETLALIKARNSPVMHGAGVRR